MQLGPEAPKYASMQEVCKVNLSTPAYEVCKYASPPIRGLHSCIVGRAIDYFTHLR